MAVRDGGKVPQAVVAAAGGVPLPVGGLHHVSPCVKPVGGGVQPALHHLHDAAVLAVAVLRVPLGGCLVRGLPQDHAGNPTKAVVLVPLPPSGGDDGRHQPTAVGAVAGGLSKGVGDGRGTQPITLATGG